MEGPHPDIFFGKSVFDLKKSECPMVYFLEFNACLHNELWANIADIAFVCFVFLKVLDDPADDNLHMGRSLLFL